jgi:predicted metallopeptidase
MSVTLCTQELKPLVEKLVKAYPQNLSEVDPDRILYLKGKGKRRPVTISSVKNPWDLCTTFKYVLTVHAKFESFDDNKKAIAIFDEILRIKDFESGSLTTHSVVGNFETLSTWGLNWLEAEAEDLAPVFKK